jgi:hypothetical protein
MVDFITHAGQQYPTNHTRATVSIDALTPKVFANSSPGFALKPWEYKSIIV